MKPSLKMAAIIHKLQHAAGSEFSASVTPEECELLLSAVNAYESLRSHIIALGRPDLVGEPFDG